MKKLLLGLGAMTAIAAPVVVAVSCGDNNTQTDAQKLASAFREVLAHPQVQQVTRVENTTEATWEDGKNVMEETITPLAPNTLTVYELTFRLSTEFGLLNDQLLNKIETAVNAAEHVQHDFTIGTYSSTAGGHDDHIEMTIYTNSGEFPNHSWDLANTANKKIVEDVLAIIEKQ